MEDHEAIDMMRRCKEEILQLRRINNELAPKADAYDQLTKVLNLLPQRSQGYSEDLAAKLERRIEELKAAQPNQEEV